MPLCFIAINIQLHFSCQVKFLVCFLLCMGVFPVRCSAVLGDFQHRTCWCGLANTITTLHLIFTSTCVVWCSLEFSQKHNHTAPHFMVTCAAWCIRCGLNSLKLYIFQFLGFSCPGQDFPHCFGLSFKLLSLFFFILGLCF